jgi:hypothetical protein
LFLDVAGAAHLFGGEASLIDDLAARLAQIGLPARTAIAATAGAAWALARFAKPGTILAAGQEGAALAPLPVEALRLTGETRKVLRRLPPCRRCWTIRARRSRASSASATRVDQKCWPRRRAAYLHRAAAGLSQPCATDGAAGQEAVVASPGV